LKAAVQVLSRMSVGRAFHADGEEHENALSPNFVWRCGTSNRHINKTHKRKPNIVLFMWRVSLMYCTGVWRSCGWWWSVRLLLSYSTAAVLQLHSRQDVCCSAAESHGWVVDRLPNQLQEVSLHVIYILCFNQLILWDQLLLYQPVIRIIFQSKPFSIMAPAMWNSLSPVTKSSATITTFEARLKTELSCCLWHGLTFLLLPVLQFELSFWHFTFALQRKYWYSIWYSLLWAVPDPL